MLHGPSTLISGNSISKYTKDTGRKAKYDIIATIALSELACSKALSSHAMPWQPFNKMASII